MIKIKQNFLAIFALLACLTLFFGCTQAGPQATPEKTSPAPQTTAPAPQTTAPAEPTAPAKTETTTAPTTKSTFDQLYDYGSIKSFEYKVSTAGSAPLNLKTTVSADTVDGKAAWLTTVDMSTEGTIILSKMWADKTTLKCLKTSTSMEVGGQKFDTPGQCPADTSGSTTDTATAASVTFVGKESVTVPAGTFNADKYTSGGANFWTSSDVPIPLKVAYANDSTTMELVAYSK
ncbi:MAG: hypothetical protein WC492_04350 [Candidatus Micrarchaeia archaeon]